MDLAPAHDCHGKLGTGIYVKTLNIMLWCGRYAERRADVLRGRDRREREHLANVMSEIREWLDARRLDPDAFRCDTDEQSVTFRLQFRRESEPTACAEAFQGKLRSPPAAGQSS